MKKSVFLQVVCIGRGYTTLKVFLTLFLFVVLQQPVNTFAASQGITLSGNKFVLNGQPFTPRGFNSIALLNSQWCANNNTLSAINNYNSAEIANAKNTWHANTLRFQVSQPVLAGSNGTAYAQQIQNNVTTALNAGFVVDISMQDQSLACGPAQPLPSQETKTAWTTLINNTSLKSNPNIMFEVFNEPQNNATTTATTDPQQMTWVDWQNGGRLIQPTSSDTWSAYTPIGHQDLINYMRNILGVTNVLIADGAKLGEHLEGLPILTDPGSGNQIAYGAHPYYYTTSVSDWNTRWGYLASTNAVLATEWNYTSSDCGTKAQTMAPQFLGYMRNTAGIGILGHALDNFKSGLPTIMADTALDPTQCGTANPGAGSDFLTNYMNTFSTLPTIPTNFTVSSITGNQINLSWTASTETGGTVAGYLIYRNGTQIANVTGSTIYSDKGLSDATTYQYTIAAYDTNGNSSGESVPVSATTTDETAPSIPTGLLATAANAKEVDLSWQASTDNIGVSGYKIYRDGNLLITLGAVTTYQDSSVSSQTTYVYTISAIDATGNESSKSASVSATTPAPPDTTPPSVPTNVTLSLSAPTQVKITWTASIDNVGVAGYTVFRNGTQIAIVTTGTTYTDSILTDATSYQYSVNAFDAAGNVSAQSTAASITTQDTTPPSVPTGLAATTDSAHQLSLSWQAATDNVGVTAYNIYRNATEIATVTNATKFTDISLADATTYSYTVTAVDAAGNESIQSTTATATTADGTAPSAPTNLTVTLNAKSISLAWNPSIDNVGVSGYTIFRNGTQIALVTSGTSYNDSNFSDAVTYQYTVSAFDAAGNNSPQSSPASVTTPDTTPPSVPTSVTVNATVPQKATVNWQAAADNVGVTGYKIYRNANLISTVTSGTTYIDSGLTDATNYTYTVSAIDTAGNESAQSTAAYVTTLDGASPTVPRNVTITLNTKNITLNWSASTDNVGVAGYTVYRNGTKLVSTTTLTYADASVVQGKTYQYTVAAYDAAGNTSAQSVSQSMKFPDTKPPTAPTNLKLSSGSKSITLTWTASTDNIGVAGYNIIRNGKQIASVAGATTYIDKNVTSGISYSYDVIAYDSAGNKSSASSTFSARAK